MGVGVVAGVLYAGWRAYRARVPQPSGDTDWEPAPFPFPPIPRPRATPRSEGAGSVDAVEGECPVSHPVKGKVTSGIYHLPGGFNYERTRADRCYVDAAAAESDGLRASKV
jgi:hypothetical protein